MTCGEQILKDGARFPSEGHYMNISRGPASNVFFRLLQSLDFSQREGDRVHQGTKGTALLMTKKCSIIRPSINLYPCVIRLVQVMPIFLVFSVGKLSNSLINLLGRKPVLYPILKLNLVLPLIHNE